MEFNLADIAVTMQTGNAARVRKALPALASHFAAACRSVSCRWPSRCCETCSARDGCAWYAVFGQELAADPSALRRYQKPPLPFVFTFPVHDDAPSDGQGTLECGLVVVGRAIQHLDMLLEGLAQFLSSGICHTTAALVRVDSRDYQGMAQSCIMDGGTPQHGDLAVLSGEEIMQSSSLCGCTDITIKLLSPLRLREEGGTLRRFNFGSFARSVVRRVTSMAYYYGEYEFETDFKVLLDQADSILCREDHFHYRGEVSSRAGGVSGYGDFCGNFDGLMPFLALGAYLHAGKGAPFGMGRYQIIPGRTA